MVRQKIDGKIENRQLDRKQIVRQKIDSQIKNIHIDRKYKLDS